MSIKLCYNTSKCYHNYAHVQLLRWEDDTQNRKLKKKLRGAASSAATRKHVSSNVCVRVFHVNELTKLCVVAAQVDEFARISELARNQSNNRVRGRWYYWSQTTMKQL